MTRKKKQEVILLHGKSQFNLDAAKAVVLKLGELAIEHGEDNVVKIHALQNDGEGLGTFITETAIDAKIADGTSGLTSDISALEATVGDETDGLVKDVADLQSTVGQHTTDISGLKTALGMGGTGDTSVTARVNELEKTVNGYTEGEGDDAQTVDGLVQKVATNTSDISALETTVGDESKGLVKDVADLKTTVGDNTAGLVKDVADLKALVGGEGTEGTIADRLSDVEDILNAETTGVVDRLVAVETKASNNETNITALDKQLNGEDGTPGIANDVADLKTTVGDNTAGLVKDVAEHTTKINTLESAVGVPSVPGADGADGTPATGLFADVEANTAAIEALKTEIDTDIATELGKLNVTAGDEDKDAKTYVSYVEQIDGKISAHYETLDAENVAFTPAEPAGTLAGKTTVKDALDALNSKDVVLAGEIDDVDARIDGLLGKTEENNGDDGRTIREIAADELAIQLIPENAADALDSLKEIAAWIQDHPEDAAAMNLEIENLQSVIANVLEDFVTVTTDDSKTLTAVKKIKTSLEALANKDTELNNAITALTQTVTGNTQAISDIKNYTVNNKKISENPVLDSTDIKMNAVVGSTATTQTVQEAIAQVNQNITTEVNAAKEDLTEELDTVEVAVGEGLAVEKAGRKFTVSIEKIDAGSYDDDGTTEA